MSAQERAISPTGNSSQSNSSAGEKVSIISADNLLAAQPTVTRGSSYHFDVDVTRNRLVYTSGRAVYMRDISYPDVAYAFSEHTANTTVAKISSNGNLVASGDVNGNIRLWNSVKVESQASNSEPGPITKYHSAILQGSVLDISWDSDGQRVLVVGDGKEKFGHVFNSETGASIGEIGGHSRRINACSLRPLLRPMKAVTAGDDISVAMHQGPPFRYQSSTKLHTKIVQDLKYSPDGNLFASVGADGGIFVYDGATGEMIQSPSQWSKGFECGHSSGVLGISWEPATEQSHRLTTCSSDGTVKIWDIHTCQLVQTFTIGSPQVGCIWASTLQNNLIISTSAPDGTFSYLDPRHGPTPTKQIYGHVKAITALQCQQGQDTFYTGGSDGRIYSWSVSDLSKGGMLVLPEDQKRDSNVHVQPPDVVVPTNSIYIQSKSEYSDSDTSQVISIVKSCESLLSIGQDDQVRFIHPYQNVYKKRDSSIISDKYSVSSTGYTITSSPNIEAPLTMIALPKTFGSIVLYEHHLEWRGSQSTTDDVATLLCSKVSIGPELTNTCVSAHPIKQILAVGCKENPNIYIAEYDLEKNILAYNGKIFQGKNKGFIQALSYSPNGRWLAVADSGRQILLYDSETMVVDSWPPKWTHHTSRIQCLAWSPDTTMLASGSLDGNIILWMVGRSANERKTILRAHQDGVNSLAFLNETSLISCGQDGCLRRWSITREC